MRALCKKFRFVFAAGLATLALALPGAAHAYYFSWCAPAIAGAPYHYLPAYYSTNGVAFPYPLAVRTYAKEKNASWLTAMYGEWKVYPANAPFAAQAWVAIHRTTHYMSPTLATTHWWVQYIEVYWHDGVQWHLAIRSHLTDYNAWLYGSSAEGECSYGP